MSTQNQYQSTTGFGAPLIQFQLDKMPISKKSDVEWGKSLAADISAKVNGGTNSYFFMRNARWRTNRAIASGKIDMSRYQDLIQFNGKQNYVNLNWQCIKLGNRIVSGLVNRWMDKREKINVTATDSLSQKQKRKRFDEIEFIIQNRKELELLEQESGVQQVPRDQKIPEDTEELQLWQPQFLRLPEEICFQLGINDVMSSNGWFDVLKEKSLRHSAVTAFIGTYTWMDKEGVIHVESLIPENCFYSYSSYPDFRDTSWRGYMRTMKISELRKQYGKEFHPSNPLALSEEELFKIAGSAKEFQYYDKISWTTEWNISFLRPYDEWNVDVLEFELKTVDSEAFTFVKTKKNGSTITKKGMPKKVRENEEVAEDSRINIYRGVYIRTMQRMVEWGMKQNMIRPQDPREVGNAEFSYSFYMVQNDDMTSLGIPEKIQEPLDQMIIARLKIQQLVSVMRPPGTAVNWRAVQNIDYGLGANNKTIDFRKYFDQTGDFFYRDRDGEGNPIGVPFTELSNSGFLPQLQGLILLYDKHYQILKDELGEDPNLLAQALKPRVSEGNVEVSQQQAEYATDQYYNGFKFVMEDTARKISCLLKDSVEAGAKAYRHIVGQEDLTDKIFSTKVEMLPDDIAIQKFELLIQKAMDTTPELSLFVDPFQLMRVAKEDVRLAEALFRRGTKKMLLWKQETAMANQQQTIKGQIDSAKIAEEEKRKTKQEEGNVDIKKAQMTAQAQNQTAVLNMAASLIQKQQETGAPIPPEFMPLVRAVMENVALSATLSSEEKKAEVLQQMQAQQQQQMQEQQPIQQPQPMVAA
jgi:hypothetical protein